MHALELLFRRFVAPKTDDTTHCIASYLELSDGDRVALEHADVVVEQVLDMAPRADTSSISLRARRVLVPHVSVAFLWPFSGQAHPRNERLPFMRDGPFADEMGDSYLNRLIARGVDPGIAVEQYAALDVNKVRNLDRLYELVIDRQKRRDEICDYSLATLIERFFREEPIALSPNHPRARLAVALASQCFERLGVARAQIDTMERMTRHSVFPPQELPIHPSVSSHFGLQYGGPTARYRSVDGDTVTFSEYASRYVAYSWNRELAEGLSVIATNPDEASSKLLVALAKSPESASAYYALGEMKARSGLPEAEPLLRRAVDLWPDRVQCRYALSSALRKFERFSEALVEIERAIVLDPANYHCLGLKAAILNALSRAEEAECTAQAALLLSPRNPHLWAILSNASLAAGRTNEAVERADEACRLEPSAAFLANLAGKLRAAGRTSEASEVMATAIGLAPEDADWYHTISSFLNETGELTAAIIAASAARALQPGNEKYKRNGEALAARRLNSLRTTDLKAIHENRAQ